MILIEKKIVFIWKTAGNFSPYICYRMWGFSQHGLIKAPSLFQK